ncbi:MAG: IS200/IS605 family transposase [Pyrinomonadaceae bacterium]
MANTFSSIYLHFVFSTENRLPLIPRDHESRIWNYIGGILSNHNMTGIEIGGVEDHLHALVRGLPRFSPSQIAETMKTDSSKWIKREFDGPRLFAWQDGYSVFSVSRSQIDRVSEYIRNQRTIHQSMTFEQEYRELLDLHEIPYNEKYLFG